MKKRILALLMCLCLCLSLLPMAALADETTSGLRLGFMGTNNIAPGDNFGAGGDNLADGSGGRHPVGVYVDGVETSAFTVTSSDESVCTVTPDGATIWVTNVGYGTSVLTVTAGGYTEQFNWCNHPAPSGGEGEDSGEMGEGGGEGPMDPEVSEDDYIIRLTIHYDGESFTGEYTGGIAVYGQEGGIDEYCTVSHDITVKGGNKFYFNPIEIEGAVSQVNVSGSGSGTEMLPDGTEVRAIYDDAELEIIYSMPDFSGLTLGFGPQTGIRPGDGLGTNTIGTHEIYVYVDGEQVSDITAVSSNEQVCTLSVENGFILLDNVGYGESELTITAGGYTATFVWNSFESAVEEPPQGTYTVNFQVNYPGDYEGDPVGGIRVYDYDVIPGADLSGLETAEYTDYHSLEEPIEMAAGEVFWYSVIPLEGYEGISDYNDGDTYNNCIDREHRAFIANGGAEIFIMVTYGHNLGGEGGEGGPWPAVQDFDVVIRLALPDDYEGDGKLVTRMDMDENGEIVDFGDGNIYGHDDVISVKAGEWAIFGAEAMDGYAVQYIFNNAGSCRTMNPDGNASYALIESVDYGDEPVEVIVEYVSTAGITLDWNGSVLRPDSGFGFGGFGTTELSVLYNGQQITDFTVTNENDDVCTVSVENGVIVLNAIGYGESVLTVTANGETERFTWVCDPGPSGDTVTVSVNYPEDFPFPQVGGVEVYDENGVYQSTCFGGDIVVGEGGRLIVKPIEIEGAVCSSSWHYCYDMEINGEIYRVIEAGGSVELFYHDESQVGDPELAIAHPGAESVIPGGVDIGWGLGVYEMEVRLDGEMTNEFNAYSSDESVCAVRNENGLLVIECRNPGWCTITIEHSRHNGIEVAYTWIYEESPYHGITLAPEEKLDEAIPAGAQFGMPVWGEYRYKVRLDTFFVDIFAVSSDNPDLCEVRNEDGWLVVNSKGYGETTIRIGVDGDTVEFTWVCEEPSMSVRPPEAGAPITDEALNGDDVRFTVSGDGQTVEITGVTADGLESRVRVDTENAQAIVEALTDENVNVGIVFGSMDISAEDISETDMEAVDVYGEKYFAENPNGQIVAMGLVDIFAELSTVYPDRPGERLGSVTELTEGIDFSMTVKKDALRELGRDIENLFILHIHDGECREIWSGGWDSNNYYEETEDSYILHFKITEFSPFILGYERVRGDIDGDDKPAEAADLVRMMKYIAGEDVTVVAESVDVTGDGQYDILDVIRLVRYLAGDDVSIA